MTVGQLWRRGAQPFAIALVGVALLTAGTAVAGQPGPGPGRGPGGRMGILPQLRGLNLTAEQKTSINTILEQHRGKGRKAHEQLRGLHDELRTAIFASGAPETGRVDQLVDQIAELESQLLRERTSVEVEIARVLTDEQRQQVRDRRAGPRRRVDRGDR